MSDAELLEVLSEATYGGNSEAPRKDFVPLSSNNSYSNPYQKGGAVWPPINRQPSGQGALPWPLQLVPIDLGDSYIYLLTAMKKIKAGVQENKALTEEQVKHLKEIYTRGKKALKLIKEMGLVFEPIADMSKPVKDVSNPQYSAPQIGQSQALF